MLFPWMKAWHVRGNNISDVMAGTAADLHRVPAEPATPKFTKFREWLIEQILN